MSHLKALKLASAVPVRSAADPVQRVREKMVAVLAKLNMPSRRSTNTASLIAAMRWIRASVV